MHRSFLGLSAAVVAAAVAVFPACGIHGPYNAEARDTWSRSYTLGQAGEITIGNVNGRVIVEGVDGSTVQVDAERIAHAATDQLARELLPRIPINDKSTPNMVQVETGRIDGILIGASFEVRFHVKAPKGATVRAATVNGGVEVQGLAGQTFARTTNGGVTAKDITGSLEARTINGGIRAQFGSLGTHDIVLNVVNGGIRVTLPESAKASINATWVNGGIHTSGLNFDVRDSGKRHFEANLNGGGTHITATVVNGGVTFGNGKDRDAEDIGDAIEKAVEGAVQKAVDKPAEKSKEHVAP